MFGRISPDQLKGLSPERICIIKPSALGDVVQTLPLLPVLKQVYPKASISWVINKGFANLLEGHPLIDKLLIFERRGTWGSWWSLLKQIRSRKFDLVFDLQGLLRTGVMTAFSGSPVRVGLETAREGSHLTTNCTLPNTPKTVPAHARNWRLADVLGHGEAERKLNLGLSPEASQWAGYKLEELGGHALVVSPGGQWITKRWPVEKYAEVVCRAVSEFGYRVLLVGSSAERELTEQLESLIRAEDPIATVWNLAGETSLQQLAALLQGAEMMLSNDSGPMHLAAELGTPTIGVFLCTDPVRSGPPGDQHIMVSTEVACRASYKKQCPNVGLNHHCCFEELSVERVWSAVKTLAESQRAQSDAA